MPVVQQISDSLTKIGLVGTQLLKRRSRYVIFSNKLAWYFPLPICMRFVSVITEYSIVFVRNLAVIWEDG